MVHLDRTWEVLLPHKVGAEGRKGVMRAGNVSPNPPFSRWASFKCGYRLRVGAGAGVSVGGRRVTVDDAGFDRSDDVDYIIPSRELPATYSFVRCVCPYESYK